MENKTTAATDPHPVLTNLRARTRVSHQRLEEVVNIERLTASRDGYAQTLCRFYGFWISFEQLIVDALDPDIAPPEMAERWRSAKLERDLVSLGIDPDQVERASLDFESWSPAEIAGRLYVTEGATLGGRIIAKRVEQELGIGAGNGASFFAGHEEETSRRWKSFCQWVEGIVPAGEREVCAGAAVGIFTSMEDWFLSGAKRS